MNANQFLIPKVKDVLENMPGAMVIRNLDMLSDYWKAQLAEDVWEMITLMGNYGVLYLLSDALRKN